MRDYNKLNEMLFANIHYILPRWLPEGKIQGQEYVAINPTRPDHKLGSFKINFTTGKWSDFATDDSGIGLISLFAYIKNVSNSNAYDQLADEHNFSPNSNIYPPVQPKLINEYELLPLPILEPLHTHYKLGVPSDIYRYENFYIYRFHTPYGKEIRPLTYQKNLQTNKCEWRWKSVEANRALYHKEQIQDLPILVVEGEKAANIVVPGYTVVTWSGGSNAVKYTDWSPLFNREVIIWPDRDEPGRKAAEEIKNILPKAKIIPIEFNINDGLDLADVNDPFEYLSLVETDQDDIKGLPQYWFDPITSRYFFEGCGYKKDTFTQIYLSKYRKKPIFSQIQLFFTQYNPQKEITYYEDNKLCCNTYRPSALSFKLGGFENIQKLIMHLVQDEEMYDLFINWLAIFFQTKQKSKVAWVFQGDQGAGKGILFDIIAKIFGESNCETVTDYQLESRFNSWLTDKLFINFNEVSTGSYSARQKVKNIIKTLITDDYFMSEKKGIDEIKKRNWANIMISSNEALPLDVEVGDRRFNIIYTGGNIAKENWFDYETIISEVQAFGYYLKHFKIRSDDYNRVVENEAKKLIIEQSDSIEHAFCSALCQRDFEWFVDAGLSDEHDGLVESLQLSFENSSIGNSIVRKLFYKCHTHTKMNAHQVGRRLAVYFKKYGAQKIGPTILRYVDEYGTTREKKEKGYVLP